MVRILFVVSIALKIFMFRDAVKRGVPTFWYWLIAFMPGGEVVYFFVHPFDDWRLRRSLARATKRPRRVAEPRVGGGIERARAAYDEQDYPAARRGLEAMLEDEPRYKEGLYLLGMTLLQLGEHDEATRPLERLRDIRAGYRDYAGWLQLAYAHYEAGRPKAAIEELEHLVERSGRLEHQVILAEYLLKAGRTEEARTWLQRCRRKPTRDADWAARLTRLGEVLDSA
jgi:tetratricopeptide (TPR) repeat protein